MGLVLIEGPDLTGKSTLAKTLADLYDGPAEVIHFRKPDQRLLPEYEDTVLEAYDPAYDDGELLVLDRGYPSEYVWPEVFGRETEFVDKAFARHVELFYCSRGAVAVHADRDPAKLAEELEASDEPLRPEKLARTLELYDQAFDRGALRGYVYTWDYEEQPLSPADLLAFAEQARQDVRPIYDVTSRWIGDPRPRALVLHRNLWRTELPGRAGDDLDVRLAQFLRSADQRWRDLLIADSSVLEPPDVAALYEACGRPRLVVALDGRSMDLALDAELVPRATVANVGPSVVNFDQNVRALLAHC